MWQIGHICKPEITLKKMAVAGDWVLAFEESECEVYELSNESICFSRATIQKPLFGDNYILSYSELKPTETSSKKDT